MLLHRMNAGADDLGCVAHHRDIEACGQQLFHIVEFLIHRVHHGHGVGAALLADGEHHGRHTVVSGDGFLLLGTVLDACHIAHPHQSTAGLAHDEQADLLDAAGLAQNSETGLAGRILHRAGGDLNIL